MKLYVIRHGETEMGKNEIIATEEEPLNKIGIQQAQKVGKELKKLNIDYLIWYAPFKYYEVPLGEEKSDLPEVCVIDIKNINQNGSYLNSYDISKMKSVEL